MTREFVKELGDDPRAVEPRFAAASVLASLLAPIGLVLGLATLAGYTPIVDTMVLMGLPQWTAPLVGVIEVAAAVALVIPVASFFGALAMIGICVVGAILYVRLAEYGFALGLAAIAGACVTELVVRAPELGRAGRKLWAAAGSG
ncbi:MAG: hypothetical protein IT382_18090 [Deltaproteobacteria bacterium]|nr:hypothetical protein [Deltaproteobacteria bacterium]